jgi:hypothetical protein
VHDNGLKGVSESVVDREISGREKAITWRRTKRFDAFDVVAIGLV